MANLVAFRIFNFRSIQDSGRVLMSHDGISVLVGQNESGKSGILQGLNYGLNAEPMEESDLRIREPLPSVRLEVEIDYLELKDKVDKYSLDVKEVIQTLVADSKGRISIRLEWTRDEQGNIIPSYDLEDIDFVQLLKEKSVPSELLTEQETSSLQSSLPEWSKIQKEVAEKIWEELPPAILFDEKTGLLPESVDIVDGSLAGNGNHAALNFLTVAGIDLQKLIKADVRARESILEFANEKITDDFNSFWNQKVNARSRISLTCRYQHYSEIYPPKSGKPYLAFWLSDGSHPLFLHQRSTGLRWYVSFYLQLKAYEANKKSAYWLLDEPGANLHSKAQEDVLKLINRLPKEIKVLYTTHSPDLVEYGKIYRIHAVQRKDSPPDYPTTVISGNNLVGASRDTLSPIIKSMGANLSSQTVIQRRRNVLIEEISAHYYSSAFWKLLNVSDEAHFIAATGVNNLEHLTNLFCGWGLKFIVVMDDDNQGRGVYGKLMRNLYGDDEEIASQNMIKIKECDGIEDLFSSEDFAKFVTLTGDRTVEGRPTALLRRSGNSKPVLAYGFFDRVKRDEVRWEMLSAETQGRIMGLVDRIRSLLTAHDS